MTAAGRAAGPLAAARNALSEERQYAPFVASAIFAGLFVGFPLGLTLALSRPLDWGLDGRYPQLVQVHGHIQLFAWFGLFVMGMGYRLVPRFTAAKDHYLWLPPITLVAAAAGIILRSTGQAFASGGGPFAIMFGAGAVLEALAAWLFATVILRALWLGRADEFGYKPFFATGALSLAAAMTLSAYLGIDAADGATSLIPPARSAVVAFLLLYGFVSMFVFAVSIRTFPVFFGRERASRIAVSTALLALAAGIAVYATAAFWQTYDRSALLRDLQNVSFLAVGAGLVLIVAAAGIFGGEAHRLRESARRNMRFVRSGYAWLTIAAVLQIYFATTALTDTRPINALQVDGVRHFIAIGFLTTVTIGMAFLVMPALAMRRLARRPARIVAIVLLALLHGAAAARGAGSLIADEGRFDEGYWTMAAGGALAIAAVAVFVAYVLRSPEESVGEQLPLTQRDG